MFTTHNYMSYDDKERQDRSLSVFGTASAALVAGVLFHKYRKPLADHALLGLDRFIKSQVGNAGHNFSIHSSAYHTEHKLVKELTKTAKRLSSQNHAGKVARHIFHSEEMLAMREAYGENNLRKVFGLGQRIDDIIAPGGQQFNSYRAFRKTFAADEGDLETNLMNRFLKLSRHSNYQELLEKRAQDRGVRLIDAQEEFASFMTKAHMNFTETSNSSKQLLKHFQNSYLSKELEYQNNSRTKKVLDYFGLTAKRADSRDDVMLFERLRTDRTFAGSAEELDQVISGLKKFQNYNVLTTSTGTKVDLSLGKEAISKIYNTARETLQIPVSPLQGGFGPFSFFPHMRGNSQQVFHILDPRNPLPFLSDITGKLDMADSSALGSMVIIGKKSLFGPFRGIGKFIGMGAEGYSAEAHAVNKVLEDIPLDIRDAKAGWLKDLNDRATNNFLRKIYPSEDQSILGRILTPGGAESTDSIFSKYKSVFTKFSNPDYIPNTYRNLLSAESPSNESIERLGLTLINKSGHIDAKSAKALFTPQTLEELKDRGIGGNLLKLLEKGIDNDVSVIEYFSQEARLVQKERLFNPQLENIVNSFSTSMSTALGYGKNNDPRTILDEIALSVKGVVGDNPKSQGVDYLRENILAEVDLRSHGFLSEVAKNSTDINNNSKNIIESYFLGHKINSLLAEGMDNSSSGAEYLKAINLLRPEKGGDIASAFHNRSIVEGFIKRQYPVLGLHWEKSIDSTIPEGSEWLRGRYLVLRASPSFSETTNTLKTEFLKYKNIGESIASGDSWDEIKRDIADLNISKDVRHFTKGLDDPSSFNVSPISHYFLSSRLNSHLATFGLSLGKDDMISTSKILGAIGFKRVLPIVAGIRTLSFFNQKRDEQGKETTDGYILNLRSNHNLKLARIKDKYGITDLEKKIANLFPGSKEFLNWRPQSEEEYKEYLKSGRDPVRKSRGWLFGSRTPYAGNSIAYFEPNAYLRAKSGYKYTSGAFNSKESFLANSHNLYAQEEKNSQGIFSSRPYVYSAPLVDPNFAFAGLINSTLGALIKPQKMLNDPTRYMDLAAPTRVNLGDPSTLLYSDTTQPVEVIQEPSGGLTKTLIRGYKQTPLNKWAPIGEPTAGNVIPLTPLKTTGRSIAVVNSAGSIVPKDVFGHDLYYSDNNHLTEEEHDAIVSDVHSKGKQFLPVRKPRQLFNEFAGKEPLNPNDIRLGRLQLLNQAKQVSGIYGFFAGQITRLFGREKSNNAVFAEASRAYSFESQFYDAQRGATFLGIPGQLVSDQNLNEIARRLITPKQKNLQYFNPIPNEFYGSDFLPGDENYVNFQQGDARANILNGIVRLPGEAYRKLYKPTILQINAKDVHLSEEDLATTMIRPNLFTVNKGKRVAAKIRKIFGKNTEVLQTVYENKEEGLKAQVHAEINNVPTIVRDISSQDFKNIDKLYEKDKAELSLVSYLSKKPVTKIVYVDNTGKSRVVSHTTSQKELSSLLSKIASARQHIRELVHNRVISEADLYDPITKFDIASDVAPYAETTRMLASNISHTPGILQNDWDKFQAIKKRTSEQKRQTEVFQYKFANLHERLRDHHGTIEYVSEKGVIYLKGQNTPLKLAGGRLSLKKIREYVEEHNISVKHGESEAEVFFRAHGIYAGKHIKVKVDSDSPYENRKDTEKTHRAVFGGLNKHLIEQGFIEDTDTDVAPTTTYIKHSKKEIFLGTMLEKISHLDTIIHTKFLKVRSPLEAYRRQVIYGTNEGSWLDVANTYIWPTMSALASKNPLTAAAQGALIGSFFGITKPAKLLGAKAGAIVGVAASLFRIGHEAITGEDAWIPPSVRRRREIEDYFDTLKYVKERKLFEEKAAEAQKHENINIKNLIDKYEKNAKRNEGLREKYLAEKRELLRQRKTKSVLEKIKELNKKIAKTKEDQDILNLGPIATEALIHRKNYQSTLYGAKAGSSLMDVMAAMPKHERTILMEALKSSDKEKKELYRLLSNNQKRALGVFLGKKTEELPDRPKLNDYFKNHQLPDEHSNVWDPSVDIEDLKTRALVKELPRTIELGIFPQTVTAAEQRTSHVAVPYPEGKTKDIQNKLNRILSGSNHKRDRVHTSNQHNLKDEDEVTINTTINHNRKKDLQDYVNRRM